MASLWVAGLTLALRRTLSRELIGAVAVGGTQHDQIWLSGASVQQNDPSCFSVLDINSDAHSSSLRRSAQVQQIGDSFRGSTIKGLAPWNGVDNDQFCVVDACQSEGLLKRGPIRAPQCPPRRARARFVPRLRPPLLIANTLPAIKIESKQRSGATQAESAQIVI